MAQAPKLPGYEHIYSGKVRDLYAPIDPKTGRARTDQVLLVASDRISAYDYILTTEIPDKGKILTQLSLWWFEQMQDLVPNHVISTDVPDAVAGRAVLVERLDMVPLEAIARAYLTGSGLADYQRKGTICGVSLPKGLGEASKLPEPIFTPTSKAEVGDHDEPMTFLEAVVLIGDARAQEIRELTTKILARGNEIAAKRGIIIADTKVEFGVRKDGTLVLADELLTPDSSRFWPAKGYAAGKVQSSYDKQFVRDWLTSKESGWSKSSGEQPPALPDAVVEKTRAKYVEAYESLTGKKFSA